MFSPERGEINVSNFDATGYCVSHSSGVKISRQNVQKIKIIHRTLQRLTSDKSLWRFSAETGEVKKKIKFVDATSGRTIWKYILNFCG